MNDLRIFLPCAAGAEGWLALEVARVLHSSHAQPQASRGGVRLMGSWRDTMLLNLHSRLAQRVLVQLSYTPYRGEDDIYAAASDVAWEAWFTPKHHFKVEITAQRSPLKSLNFALLRVKDAVADRFRHKTGIRPDVQTQWPDVRLYTHLTQDHMTLYIDTSGEPLFKRGWRADKGDAPLKETLAAAMLAASGWSMSALATQPDSRAALPASTSPVPALGAAPSPLLATSAMAQGQPLYDPCCGSGTIAIEAAQMACGIAPGLLRRFGFEKLLPFQSQVWQQLQDQAHAQQCAPQAPVFGSDVAHRMVDFAQRNAERAGVAHAVQLRGGDALQRMPPCEQTGLMLINPPYGERISVAGVAGAGHRGQPDAGDWDEPAHAQPRFGAREITQVDEGGDFFVQLASHWKKNFADWSAWVLTPDLKLPSRMRLKETRRVPMWNGPIECRLFRFDVVAGSARKP